jgi:hypothetical protein
LKGWQQNGVFQKKIRVKVENFQPIQARKALAQVIIPNVLLTLIVVANGGVGRRRKPYALTTSNSHFSVLFFLIVLVLRHLMAHVQKSSLKYPTRLSYTFL